MTDYFSTTLANDDIRAISSIGLAHLGDAVYELLVRTYLCAHGKATGKGMHRATIELVCAPKQAELAARVGVAQSTISDIEHGHIVPGVYLALRIARALASSVEKLFPLPEDMEAEKGKEW